MKKVSYAIYDIDDNIIFVGTVEECADFLNVSTSTIYVNVTRTRNNVYQKSKFRIYRIEDDEE